MQPGILMRMVLTGLLCVLSELLYSQIGKQVYTAYCAGCHGQQLQGGQAGKLIKSDWIYGRHRNDLMRNVRYGVPNTDMSGWRKILKTSQIDSVVNYIIRSQKTPLETRKSLPAKLATRKYAISI